MQFRNTTTAAYALLGLGSLWTGSIVQLDWASRHGYEQFVPRTAITAVVLFIVALLLRSALARIADRGAVLSSRFVRIFLATSIATTALLLTNTYAKSLLLLLAIAYATAVWLRAGDGIERHWNPRTVLFAVYSTLWLAVLAIVEPPINGVSLHLEQIQHNDYFRFLSQRDGQRISSRVIYRSARDYPQRISFALPRNLQNQDQLYVHLGFIHDATTVAGLSVFSRVLLWKLPLIELGPEAVSDFLRTPPQRFHTTLHDINGRLIARSTAAGRSGPWLLIPYEEVAELRRATGIWDIRSWLVRLAWLCIGVAGYFAIVYAVWSPSLRSAGWNRLQALVAGGDNRRQTEAAPSTILDWRVVAAGFAALIVVLFARSWIEFTTPSLHQEDASYYFNRYYGGDRDLYSIFEKFNRYIVLVPNLFAWTVSHVAGAIQPGLYLSFSILSAAAAVFLVSSSGLFRSRPVLFAAPLVLGLSGYSHIYYWITLAYQLYSYSILAITILFLDPPKTRLRFFVRAILLAGLIWSGPYSVLVLPVCLLLLLSRAYRGNEWLYLWAILCCLGYYLSVDAGTTRPLIFLDNPARIGHYLTILFENVYLLNVFGVVTVNKVLLLLLFISASIWHFRRDKRYVAVSLSILTITVLGPSLAFLTIKYNPFDIKDNYVFIAYFFWLVFLLMTADRLIRSVNAKSLPGAVFTVSCGVFVLYDNVVHVQKHTWAPREGVSEFFSAVRYFEDRERELSAKQQYIVLELDQHKPPFYGPVVTIGNDRPGATRITRDQVLQEPFRRFVPPE